MWNHTSETKLLWLVSVIVLTFFTLRFKQTIELFFLQVIGEIGNQARRAWTKNAILYLYLSVRLVVPHFKLYVCSSNKGPYRKNVSLADMSTNALTENVPNFLFHNNKLKWTGGRLSPLTDIGMQVLFWWVLWVPCNMLNLKFMILVFSK